MRAAKDYARNGHNKSRSTIRRMTCLILASLLALTLLPVSEKMAFAENAIDTQTMDDQLSVLADTLSLNNQNDALIRPLYSTGDDYPADLKASVPDSIVRWGYYSRECTSFVAWCLISRNGVSNFNNWYGGVNFGNANTWGSAARAIGISVDMNPAVGSVAWTTAGGYGHVAWVSAVSGNSVTIEEYNYNFNYSYNKRTVSKTAFNGYIHIKDIQQQTIYPRPSTSANIPNGVYSLQHQGSGKYVSAGLSHDDGVVSYIWPWAEGSDQKFTLERQADNTYIIKSNYSNKVLDVVGGVLSPEATVAQWSNNGNSQQRWYIVDKGGGYVQFVAKHSGQCLDVRGNGSANSTVIQQYPPNGSPSQHFKITLLSPTTSDPVPDGIYSLQHQGSGKYVSAGLSHDDGVVSYIWPWAEGSDQKFTLERQADNTYIIKSNYSNKVLDVVGGGLSIGDTVAQWSNNGNSQQRWYIISRGNGYYKFIAKHSGQCLDVRGNGSASGTVIQQYPDNGSPSQSFKITPLETIYPLLSMSSIERISENTAVILFDSNVSGAYYYKLLESGADAPTDMTSGSSIPLASGENKLEITNLLSSASYDIYIAAKSSEGISSKAPIKIEVPAYVPPASLPLIVTDSLADATIGASYVSSIEVSGTSPIEFNLVSGTLPPELTFDKSTGSITGTPSSSGQMPPITYSFTVQASNAAGVTSKDLSITVVDHPEAPHIMNESLSIATKGINYTETLFSSSTLPVTWSLAADTTSMFPSGLLIDQNTGIISGIPNEAGSYSFTIHAQNETGSKFKQFSIEVLDPVGLPEILNNSLPDALVGVQYSTELSASGLSPIEWSCIDGVIPKGLMLNSSEGTLVGTPTEAGLFVFTLQAKNSLGIASLEVTILVNEAQLAPTIETKTLKDAKSGEPYSEAIFGQGTEPISWNIVSGSLPQGLTLQPSTGIITGTPNEAGSYTFTVQALNTAGNAFQQLTIQVSPAITFRSIANANASGINEYYSYTGNAIKPSPLIVLDGDTLIENKDYMLEYKNNINTGIAEVLVSGINEYLGSITITFTIVDKKVFTYSGSHRYETAHAVVRAALNHKTHNKGVIVASGESNKYADTLSASGLAGALGYPIVLTNGSAQTLSQEARSNILQIADGGKLDVIIVGAEPTVSQAIERELQAYDNDGSINRLAGNDRYETCMKIYNYGKSLNLWNTDYAIFTTGDSFADALGIAGFASSSHAPIFLVSRNATALSPEMATALSAYSKALVLGDDAAVKESVYAQINGIVTGTERLGGSHRYETAAKVVEWQIGQGMSLDNCGIATGDNFADALGSGFLMSRTGSVLVLVSPNEASNVSMLKKISAKNSEINTIHIFGSSSAVSHAIRDDVLGALDWRAYKTEERTG